MNFISCEEDLKINKGLSMLYFYTPWLIYHKKMMVMIEKMEEKHKDISYIGIDGTLFKKLNSVFNVSLAPTVIVLYNGKEINRIEGLCLTSAFKAFFDDIYKKVVKVED